MKKIILSIAIFFALIIQSSSHVGHYKKYNYLEYELFRNNSSIGYHKYDFKRNGDNSGSLINCINDASGHNGKIVASLSSHKNVLLTQAEPGPDGNKAVSGSAPMSASGQSGIISTNGSFSF